MTVFRKLSSINSNLSTDIRNIPSVSIFKTIMKNTSVTMNGLILARRNVILFHCQLRNMQINLTLIFFFHHLSDSGKYDRYCTQMRMQTIIF